VKFIRILVSAFLTLFLFSCVSVENTQKDMTECAFSHLDGYSGREYMENLISYRVMDSISSGEGGKFKNLYRHLDYLVNKLIDEDYRVMDSIPSDEIDKFKNLDNLMNHLSDPDCRFADGRSVQNFITKGFDLAYTNIKDKEVILGKIKVMQERYPDAVYPLLAEAQFWIYYAWEARGTGYARTVTPSGWKLFRERLSIAEKILIESKEKASVSPVWYLLMYSPVFHLDSSQEEKDNFYAEAFKQHKDFLPLLIRRRNGLRPRWGGSWKKVDEFINWSADNTKEIEGLGMYSRLYFGVYNGLRDRESLFVDTYANWDTLKAGFKDLVKRYPDSSFHKKVFALLACEANDKSTYSKIRSKIDGSLVWRWSPRLSVADCDKNLGYAQQRKKG